MKRELKLLKVLAADPLIKEMMRTRNFAQWGGAIEWQKALLQVKKTATVPISKIPVVKTAEPSGSTTRGKGVHLYVGCKRIAVFISATDQTGTLFHRPL